MYEFVRICVLYICMCECVRVCVCMQMWESETYVLTAKIQEDSNSATVLKRLKAMVRLRSPVST